VKRCAHSHARYVLYPVYTRPVTYRQVLKSNGPRIPLPLKFRGINVPGDARAGKALQCSSRKGSGACSMLVDCDLRVWWRQWRGSWKLLYQMMCDDGVCDRLLHRFVEGLREAEMRPRRPLLGVGPGLLPPRCECGCCIHKSGDKREEMPLLDHRKARTNIKGRNESRILGYWIYTILYKLCPISHDTGRYDRCTRMMYVTP